MIDSSITKNFYRVDEVCASLRKSIRNCKYTDALFWVEELYMSECYEDINLILLEVWIFLVNYSDIEWLKRWYACSQTMDVIKKTTISLIHTIKAKCVNVTVFEVYISHRNGFDKLNESLITELLKLPNNTVNNTINDNLSAILTTLDINDENPSKRKKTSTNYIVNPTHNLINNLMNNPIKKIYTIYQNTKHYTTTDFYNYFKQFISKKDLFILSIFSHLENTQLVKDALRIVLISGIVKGFNNRIPIRDIDLNEFPISKELIPICEFNIYGLSERGRLSYTQTTFEDIRNDILTTLLRKGAPYWKKAIKKISNLTKKNDDFIELFYDTYFPYNNKKGGDIPDEWNLKEQEITHGKGSLFDTEKYASVVKWYRSFFSDITDGIILKNVEECEFTGNTLFEIR